MTTLPSRMRGMSAIGWLAVLVVVVVFGTAAVKMIPAYMDYNTICGTINELMSDPQINLMSTSDVEDSISKRFDINNVNVIHARDLDITRQNGKLHIGVDYDVKRHLFYNISVVMHFHRDFNKTLNN